jgi:hypothetical protein
LAARGLVFKLNSKKELAKKMAYVKTLGRAIINTPAQEAQNADMQRQGAQIAAANPVILAAKSLDSDPGYQRGFDIGTRMGLGQTLNGPGKDAARLTLSANAGGSQETQRGFDAALALQFGITKSGGQLVSASPNVNAGALITQGLAGLNVSPDQKASTMAVVASNSMARQGARVAIQQVANGQKSLWTRFWEALGF